MSTVQKLPYPEEKVLETSKTVVGAAKLKERLREYGMNADYFTMAEGEIKAAEAFKTDEEIKSRLKAITKLKNDKLLVGAEWGEGVKIRMELAFKQDKGVLQEFPTNWQRAKKDEKIMLEVIPAINSLIEKYVVQLTEKGLPANHKEKGIALRSELDNLNQEQEELLLLGPQYTKERVLAYMKIYNRVNEINKAGRMAYKDSPADLEVFRTPWPTPEKKSSETSEGGEGGGGKG